MLDKLKFNNLVISNKKGIQQSRIQTINKLVHKIRKLKTLLEKHPDDAKCKERIRKSTETMELLKKLKRVDIMKNVLLLDKPAAAIITNGLATPEEVGVALLTMNKVMQGLIKRFKTELHLNETETYDWKQALRESSKRRQKIERTEEKRRKRMEMKQQKALGRKRQEWLEENQKGMENENPAENEGELNNSTTGPWQVEELSNDNDLNKEETENKTSTTIKRPIKEKTLKRKADREPHNKKQKRFSDLKKETAISIENGKEEESETEQNSEFHPEKSFQVEEEDDVDAEENLVVDPFFITDTGENYLSTAVSNVYQNDDNENSEDKMDLHMIKLNNADKNPVVFRERRHQNKNSKEFTQNRNKFNKEDGKQNNKWNNKQNNIRDKVTPSKRNDKKQRPSKEQDFKHKRSINNKDEKLHPSWAAKQKLKPVIKGFQGKKITFGDDNNGQITSVPKQQKQNKTATPKLTASEQDSLHPSWAAKQKLKPTITSFQGKKITFDNDD
ncbi:rlb1 [Cochliomyia hominivorax]